MINALYFDVTLLAVVLLTGVITRYRLRRKSEFFSGCVILAIVGIGVLIWGFANRITVVNDQNQVEDYTSFFSQSFKSINGKTLEIPYEFGWRESSVINNGKKPFFYETVVYGSNTIPIKSFIINQYSVQNKLPAVIYYPFQSPPNKVTLRFVDSTERGWLHR